jgi:hypothetical protein
MLLKNLLGKEMVVKLICQQITVEDSEASVLIVFVKGSALPAGQFGELGFLDDEEVPVEGFEELGAVIVFEGIRVDAREV